ncbi:MAG TPA: hypothetical protein DCM53_10060 [Enterobacteriaceae bacterium]|nr:hypothetical protein [Enterobacteriaceae bacterium]
MIMIIIVMRSGRPLRCKPESTTLLTLLPVFLSQPRAGFFLPEFSLNNSFTFFEQRRQFWPSIIPDASGPHYFHRKRTGDTQ